MFEQQVYAFKLVDKADQVYNEGPPTNAELQQRFTPLPSNNIFALGQH